MVLGVYIKGIYAGELEKKGAQSYVFTYDEAYRTDSGLPALCLNMPKSQAVLDAFGNRHIVHGVWQAIGITG